MPDGPQAAVAAEHQAEAIPLPRAIADGLAAVELARREHLVEGGLAADAPVVEVLIPPGQVFHRGEQAGWPDGGKRGDGDLRPAGAQGIRCGAAPDDLSMVVVKVGVLHAQGLEHLGLGEGMERLAGHAPDGDRRRMLPAASVLPFAASGGIKPPLAQPLAQGSPDGPVPDPDLARVVDAWPTLPDHIKAAVLALVTTARGA
jgi:hypothetical protein